MPFYLERPDKWGGIQQLYKFPNGYGASVVKSPFSYGGPEGLWEVAVLDSSGRITYDTPITDDVVGYLNDQELDELLIRIRGL